MFIILNMTCVVCSTYYNGLLNIADIPFKLLATKAYEKRGAQGQGGGGRGIFLRGPNMGAPGAACIQDKDKDCGVRWSLALLLVAFWN